MLIMFDTKFIAHDFINQGFNIALLHCWMVDLSTKYDAKNTVRLVIQTISLTPNALYCTHRHTDGMLHTNYFLNQYSILTVIHAPLFINEKLLSIPDMARHINNLIIFGATKILRFIPFIWDIAGEFILIIIFYYKCYKIIIECCLLICNSVQFIIRLSPMCCTACEW